MDIKNKTALGCILTLIGGSCWGLSATCAQYLFAYKGASTEWLVPLRLVSAGVIMLTVLFIKNGRRTLDLWRSKRHAFHILIFGAVGMLGSQFTYFKAIGYSNAGTATVLQYLGPAMILVYMCIKNRAIPKAYEVVALILAVSGTFIIATHCDLSGLVIPLPALVWGLLSALTLLIYTVQPVELLQKYDTLTVIGWGMLIGGIVLSPITRPWNYSLIVDAQSIIVTCVIILFGTIASFSCYLSGVKLIGPTRASLIACVEPVSAALLSALWLEVKFELVDLIGFALIISTIFIISIYSGREAGKGGKDLKA